MLELKDVTKCYKIKSKARNKDNEVNALNGINIVFEDRGFNFILGKSGCGKTTLLNILAGLDAPTSGSVVFDGKNLENFRENETVNYRNAVVGTVFQEYYLIPYYSVGENVKLALDLQEGLSEEEKIALVNEYLRKVELVDEKGETLYDRAVSELSGGQKQRIAIARAIIKKPKILLADEPTGALDYKTGKEIFKLLREISSECLVIVVTHDEEFATSYGDRVLRMQDGKIIDDEAKTVSAFKPDLPTTSARATGELSFKHCFKMGAVALTRKRIRLVLSMICFIFTLIAMGFSSFSVSLDPDSARLKKAYANDDPFICLSFYDEYIHYDMLGQTHTSTSNQYDLNGQKTELWKNYGLQPIADSPVSLKDTIPLTTAQKELLTGLNESGARTELAELNNVPINLYLQNVLNVDFRGAVSVSESYGMKPDERFKDKTLCSYPQTINEVAISDLKADAYIAYGFVDADGVKHDISAPDDLIGLKITQTHTICGVFAIPDAEFIRTYTEKDASYESSCVLIAQDSIANYVYVCPDYYELIDGVDSCYKFSMPLIKGYSSDYNLLRKLEFTDGEDHYYVNVVSCIYDYNVNIWDGFAQEFKPVMIIIAVIFGVFSVLLTLNYLSGSLDARKKEFGILLALGAKKSSLRNIFLTECILIAVINVMIAFVLLWILCVLLNIFVFRLVYFLVDLLTAFILLLAGIAVMGVAALFALKTLNKMTPKNIINISEK